MFARSFFVGAAVAAPVMYFSSISFGQIAPALIFGPDRPRVRATSEGAGVMASANDTQPRASGDDPFADAVVGYVQGTGAAAGFTDPNTTLGSPERFTGEGVFPGAVTVFNSPFGTDELVSIGEGGSLTVSFVTPVTDDPNNLYGIDLLVFGNALFVFDGAGVSNPAGLFSEPTSIEVSDDGVTWHVVPGVNADDLYPTEGYQDHTDPFATIPGAVDSVFTRPVDPALVLDDFSGLSYAQVLGLYRGSGGGAGVDLADVGLAEISFVRIVNPVASGVTPEIDAFADVAPRRPGDVDLDGVVGINDFLLMLAGWGVLLPGAPPADFENDGMVGINDFLIVLANWG